MAEQHEYLRDAPAAGARTLVTAGRGGGRSADRLRPAPGPAERRHGDRRGPRRATPKAPGSLVAPFGRHLGLRRRPEDADADLLAGAARGEAAVSAGRPEPDGPEPEGRGRGPRSAHPGLTGELPAVDQYYLHAALDGLRPGTTYYYGVGHEGFDPADPRHRSTIASRSARRPRARRRGSSSPPSATRASS